MSIPISSKGRLQSTPEGLNDGSVIQKSSERLEQQADNASSDTLERAGNTGALNFRLMSITPAPAARGDNDWIVQLNMLSSGVVGAPLTGATLKVTPFMPAHGHESGVTATITELADPGQYKLSPVNFSMNGIWETTIRGTLGATTDSAMFKFCIP